MSSISHGERRREQILLTGLHVWREKGSNAVSARGIGRLLGMTHAAVIYHFKTSEGLRQAVAEYAVRVGDSVVVPQLITSRHPSISGFTPEQRSAYLQTVS